jgi:hypothetical protein
MLEFLRRPLLNASNTVIRVSNVEDELVIRNAFTALHARSSTFFTSPLGTFSVTDASVLTARDASFEIKPALEDFWASDRALCKK